jgi:hypothetical protein
MVTINGLRSGYTSPKQRMANKRGNIAVSRDRDSGLCLLGVPQVAKERVKLVNILIKNCNNLYVHQWKF